MEETAAPERDKSSPWPVFVALGLALGEVGVFLAIYPLAIAGLLLFAGSVSGIVEEAGYTERPWRLLGALGAAFVLLGVGIVATQLPAQTADAWLRAADSTDPNVVRGFSVVAAGVIVVAAGGAGAVVEPETFFGANQ